MSASSVGSARPVVDFDHHSADYQSTARDRYRTLRDECPVAWSEHHGGFWIMSSYEAVWSALRDHETFSSARYKDEDGRWHGGLAIPDLQTSTLLPLHLDPPAWLQYRRILNPWLAPAHVEPLRPRLTALAASLFDRVAAAGECDLITAIGNPFPAIATLDLLGLDVDEWERWASPHHAIQFAPPGSDEFVCALADLDWQRVRLTEELADRRRRPRDDMATAVASSTIDDHLISLEDGAALLSTLISGGVSSSTALFANSVLHLGRDRDGRRWLLEDLDARLPTAIEEMLREFPPVPIIARTVNGGGTLGGVEQCPRERVAVSLLSANHDAAEFAEPDHLDLERFPNRHVSFGIGIHRCVGSYLARMIVQLMLEQVLRRAPDFAVDESAMVRFGPSSTIDGWISLPVTFTPEGAGR